jgi:hypothetical protein
MFGQEDLRINHDEFIRSVRLSAVLVGGTNDSRFVNVERAPARPPVGSGDGYYFE